MLDKFLLKNRHIVLFVLFGTIIRGVYGGYVKTWLETPDQLAWELTLDQMLAANEFSYKQLMYYPHEGGGFIIALLAICLKPFAYILPALSWTALLIDTGARIIQIKLTQRLFGSQTAFWYSIWTVMAIPLLISWSSINFCLHHLSSTLPFVFLYALTTSFTRVSLPLLCGLVTGVSISFSYNNFVFIPVFVAFIILKSGSNSGKLKELVKFGMFTFLAILPHLLLRTLIDNGFHLENLAITDVREFSISHFFSTERITNLFKVFIKPLPASFFLAIGGYSCAIAERLVVLLFFASGFFYTIRRKEIAQKEVLAFLLIAVFVIIYALSPFYTNEGNSASYYTYRHLAYIIPLLVVMLIHVFEKEGQKGLYFISAWLGICFTFSFIYIVTTKPVTNTFYKEEGWILARKFGEEPLVLMKFYNKAPEFQKADLSFGFGWGIAASLLRNKTPKDTLCLKQWENIYYQFPETSRKYVYEGIQFAFGNGITPRLDTTLLLEFNNRIIGKNK